jgi:hypothetical protein
MSKFLYLFLLFVFLSSCKTNRTVILSELAPKPIGPYSQAVLVSNTWMLLYYFFTLLIWENANITIIILDKFHLLHKCC